MKPRWNIRPFFSIIISQSCEIPQQIRWKQTCKIVQDNFDKNIFLRSCKTEIVHCSCTQGGPCCLSNVGCLTLEISLITLHDNIEKHEKQKKQNCGDLTRANFPYSEHLHNILSVLSSSNYTFHMTWLLHFVDFQKSMRGIWKTQQKPPKKNLQSPAGQK